MNVELSEATIAVYLERLLLVDPRDIAEAGTRTIEDWAEPSKMPPLKFILDRIGQSPLLVAEQAWEFTRRLVQRDWYPDGIGWSPLAQDKLTGAILHGIRACGGEYRIHYASEKEFPFIRRDFLEAYQRFVEDRARLRLTKGEAATILQKLHGEMETQPKYD